MRYFTTKLASSLFLSLHNSQKQIDPHLGLGENLHRGAMPDKHKEDGTDVESNKSILVSLEPTYVTKHFGEVKCYPKELYIG